MGDATDAVDRETIDVHPAASTSLDPLETSRTLQSDFRSLSDLLPADATIFRHSGWATHRDAVYRSFVRTCQTADRKWNFAECGKRSYVLESIDNPGQYRIAGSMCHDRFCLPCANTRSHCISGNVIAHLQERDARFITLTLHSTDEALAPLLAKLTRCFGRLRTLRQWKKRVYGGVAFLEVKRVPGRERWNVHLHLLATGSFFPQRLLSKLWHKVTGDSTIVDIRFAANKKCLVHYITKYASKPLHHSILKIPERLDEAVLAMKGRRLCTTFGNWRGVPLTKVEPDDNWQYVAPLWSLLRQAREGDADAIRICNRLGKPDVIVFPEAKPRPPPPKPRMKPLTEADENLLFPIVYRPPD